MEKIRIAILGNERLLPRIQPVLEKGINWWMLAGDYEILSVSIPEIVEREEDKKVWEPVYNHGESAETQSLQIGSAYTQSALKNDKTLDMALVITSMGDYGSQANIRLQSYFNGQYVSVAALTARMGGSEGGLMTYSSTFKTGYNGHSRLAAGQAEEMAEIVVAAVAKSWGVDFARKRVTLIAA